MYIPGILIVFAGYYGNCYINLAGSQLTTIDEGVFRPMLQQMMSVMEGSPLIINFEYSNLLLLTLLFTLLSLSLAKLRFFQTYTNSSFRLFQFKESM